MAIIQALPGSGKTYLVNLLKKTHKVYDLDVLVRRQSRAGDFAAVLRSPKKNAAFWKAFNEADQAGLVFVPFDPSLFRHNKPELRVAYPPIDYLKHVQEAGRSDLVEKVGMLKLLDYATGYFAWNEYAKAFFGEPSPPADLVVLNAGQFLADSPRVMAVADRFRKDVE